MSTARAARYSYRASSSGIDDINVAYSADLTALTRLEVNIIYQIGNNFQNGRKIMLFNGKREKEKKKEFLRLFHTSNTE